MQRMNEVRSSSRKTSTQRILPAVVNERQAAEILGLAVQTLRNWRHQRRGPAWIKQSRRLTYLVDDLERYLRDHRIDPREGTEASGAGHYT